MPIEDQLKDQEKVVASVLEEVKKVGAASKENHETVQRDYESLKKLVNESATKSSVDALLKEQIEKYSADISVRQDELDKKAQARMDAIEIASKRLGGSVGSETDPEMKSARQWMKEIKAAGPNSLTHEAFEAMEIDLKGYQDYKSAFGSFLRNPGDERALSPERFKSLSVGVDPDGGYTVTPEMSSRIVARIFEMDPIRQLASSISITTQSIEMLVDDDQAGAGWESETVANGETTTPQLNKKRIPVHVMSARPRATQVLLEDSGINAENWLSDHVSRRFSRLEAAAFVSGDGVGKPRGFLDYANGTTWNTIEQVAMGAAAALTTDGFISVKYALIEEYLNRGTWLMNRSAVQAAMKLKDGDGAYIWSPGLSTEQTSTILNLPVRMSTTMPAVAAGALSVALADWSDTYLIVDRLGISVQRDPYTAKPYVEFYTRKRVGGDVVNFRGIKLGVVSV